MIDSIGLGDFLANWFIVFLILVSFAIFIFLKKNKNNLSLVWLSCSLNVVAFFYFMGSVSYLISTFNIFIWPTINLILIALYVRKKKQ